ncbi:unnamed protein product [Eruca vesicaria subsp. sativa]|uniref:Protein kinase domain-containing protein n=1 Tax=Eruca vesicaria subsp. sativa TaxID=29727 RepID=A0ABC8JEI1_ERUVS|nr:unnamed protein product [Eruca vesicaria subsp. sativa]
MNKSVLSSNFLLVPRERNHSLKSDTLSDPADQSGDSNELIVIEDLDFAALRLIKVLRLNHLPMDLQKKDVQETEFKHGVHQTGTRFKKSLGKETMINDVFNHVSDANRILREINLLWLLRHPDVVEIKHIMLPLTHREFVDIYVVFELMESDLHQVIKANDDLTPEHYQFFLYQLLCGLKYVHAGLSF